MLVKKFNLNQMKKALLVATACASMSVFAEEATVWKDSAGDVTNDGAGNCLHTIWWQKDSSCGNKDADLHKHGDMQHSHKGGSEAHEHKAEPTAQPAPVPAPAKPQYAEFSLSSSAAFALSGSDLSPEGQAEIKEFAAKLEGHDVDKITVEGYTDNTGDAAFNQDLSEKRAKAVKDEMVKNGIDASLITVIGHGENDPVADNSTREGRAKNRRVKVSVEGNKVVQQ